jgi:hypothetical protein
MTPTRRTGTSLARCTAVCFRIAATFSAWLRLRFFRVKASDAVSAIDPVIVSLSRKASARRNPFSLNQRLV